jgi:RNA 2',3'-cyclic 3'-phosphodiesterase
VRVFVAVFPPPEVQRALVSSARTIPTESFRLTAPERVHLTLKFLGDVQPEDLPRITSALERMPRQNVPFDATTSRFGAFPSARRARILWAGIDHGAEELQALARAVESILEPEGFAREGRPFIPHLTLGRARRPSSIDLTDADHPELRFTVSKIDLVESKHEPTGVAYSILKSYNP